MTDMQIAAPLTNDEATVLMIAAKGQSMIAIGRWEVPIRQLVARGLMKKNDAVNFSITDPGLAALSAHEEQVDAAVVSSTRKLIDAASSRVTMQRFSEQAATLLAQAASESARITGDAPAIAAERWAKVILDRALELLKSGEVK